MRLGGVIVRHLRMLARFLDVALFMRRGGISDRADDYVVLNLDDAGSRPSGVHRFLIFNARANGAAQAYDSVCHMHLDMTAVDQCIASEGCFDGRALTSAGLT